MRWVRADKLPNASRFASGERLIMGTIIVASVSDNLKGNAQTAVVALPGIPQRETFPNVEKAKEWSEEQVLRWFNLVGDRRHERKLDES